MESNQLPYRWAVVDSFAPAELVTGLTVPDRYWGYWTRYNNDCERCKRTCRCFDALGGKWRKLFDWLNSQASRLGRQMVGEPLQPDPTLHGGGLHVTDPGGYLQSHIDYRLHPHLGKERRLNVILFLNQEWQENWGGALEFYGDDGTTVVHRVFPAFNRAVFFEPTDLAYHGTQPTTLDSPPRVSAAAYYLSDPRPDALRKRALFVPRR